jgi:RNA polymerase sigma-70 factor (ECF subfamily)
MPADSSLDKAAADKDDLSFVRRVADGDPDAVEAVYERYGGLIFRFCLRLSKDKSIAEEVTQDVFLALIRQASDFDARRGELSTWLCGIARNLVWNYLRRSQRWESLEDDCEVDISATTSMTASPYEVMENRDMSALLWRSIDELPPLLREILILCEFEDLSYQAAATITKVPLGTVRSRLSRSKARLAQLLRDNGSMAERRVKDHV